MKTKPIHKKIPKIVEIVPDKYHDFLFPDTAFKLKKKTGKSCAEAKVCQGLIY